MPLLNIFKKSSKKEVKKKPSIVVDIHEKNSLVPSELVNLGIEIDFKPLKVGDYLINKTSIERKTLSDLEGSIMSKRIVEQIKNLKQYKIPILIVEGQIDKARMNKNAIRGFILSTMINQGVLVIMTKDSEDTASYLATLVKQQSKISSEITLHGRIPKTFEEQKQYVLESFPEIGPKTAKKLLKNFNSLLNIFQASEQELFPFLRGKTLEFKKLIS